MSNVSTTKLANSLLSVERFVVYSDYLEREVQIDAYLPKSVQKPEQMSLLLVNDGQDLVAMKFEDILEDLYKAEELKPLMCLGIHCGEERKREYGVSYSSDFKQRGDKAGLYSKFILDELLPYVRKHFNMPHFKEKCYAGFSLGGLSAMDIAWNHSSEFSKVGVFSGSFWWRRKSYDDGYDDELDRLMHLQIRKGKMSPWLQFYIQTGELDEKADRNQNGIIDSIDDALDLVVELKAKGYTEPQHIQYVQLADGKHDVPTWAKAFPDFLKWGWGTKKV